MTMIFRKILNTKWVVLHLLVGSVLAVAFISSIPIYTGGALQRLLIKDLENQYLTSGEFPGHYRINAGIVYRKEYPDTKKMYRLLHQSLSREKISRVIDLPIVAESHALSRGYLSAKREHVEDSFQRRTLQMETLSGFEDHVKMVQGRMFSQDVADGPYEVVVTEQAIQELDLLLGEVYTVSDVTNLMPDSIRVKVVGVFTVKDDRDPYWMHEFWKYETSLFVSFDVFRELFVTRQPELYMDAVWHYAFDYRSLKVSHIDSILSFYERQKRWLAEHYVTGLKAPFVPVLEGFTDRERQLRLTLWSLQLPVLLMLVFFLLLVAGLKIFHERDEIAVLKSRGAGNLQILAVYAGESALISAAALIVGPPVGYVLCRMLGSSNGFLEFVRRSPLPATLTPRIYLYSLAAVGVFMVSVLVPAAIVSHTTVVVHKQRKYRRINVPLWRTLLLDVFLLGSSAYGLYRLKASQEILTVAGMSGLEIGIDPVFYLVATVFILSAGMLLLHLFPYVVEFTFHLGRKAWSPIFFTSLIQIGRSRGEHQIIMLFLVFTLSIGIFNAGAARTLNSHMEERIFYNTGSDIVVEPLWQSSRTAGVPVLRTEQPVYFGEPPFEPYATLYGIAEATKVFSHNNAGLESAIGETVHPVAVMGIIPHEFGRAAWFRTDLLPHHWFEYLNLLSTNQTGALLSSSLKRECQVQVGDTIWLSWEGQDPLEVVVYAFIDYWPTYQPHAGHLVVTSLSYIQSATKLAPYKVWLKKDSFATSERIYQDFEKEDLKITGIMDAGQNIIALKNDPIVQGINGSLTLGFAATLAVSMIGFLLYWTLAIRRRVPQFGLSRAIGMSRRGVVAVLVMEQAVVSCTAIIIGVFVGWAACHLFVPVLLGFSGITGIVPPLTVVIARSDYNRIYLVVCAMLAAVFCVLRFQVSRIKMDRAIKLGEE